MPQLVLPAPGAAARPRGAQAEAPRSHRPQRRPLSRRAARHGFSASAWACGTAALPRASRQRRGCTQGGRLAVRAGPFEGLSAGLNKAWDIVRKDGKLTAENIKGPMREIRRALLEADVSLPVVRKFVGSVEERALGAKVLKGVKPEQQLVKVVHDALVELMGGQQEDLVDPKEGPQIILMAGLQGVGKTTACGKLAIALQKRRKRVLMVATDVYRPAAIEQLVTLGQKISVPVFELGTQVAPAEIARKGVEQGRQEDYDAIIVDTAGRLQVDEGMMAELTGVREAISPTDTLLVVDAMTGQEAAALVKSFNEAAPLTGAILTKTDGDSRGGAALSVRAVSGRPIKFVGTGEKLEALEPFYPERIASRILGMGDVLTLVEKAEASIKEDDAKALQERMMKDKFDFNDYLQQYKMVSGMGNMGQLMRMIPGLNQISDKQMMEAERQLRKSEIIIQAMTEEERADPQLLATTASRRRRVARGASVKEQDVSELLTRFTMMKGQMRGLTSMMRMGGGGAAANKVSAEEMNKQLLASSQAAVTPGKVRRRKQAATRRPVTVGGKGFGGA